MGEEKFISYGKKTAMEYAKRTSSIKDAAEEARRNGYKTVREWGAEKKGNSK